MTDRSHLVEAMKAATVQTVAKGGVQRVAIVVAELRGGGAERVVVHLATALRQLGVTTEIVCIRRPGVLAEDAQAAGVPVVALNSLRGYDVGAVLALRRELRRFHPDVINVHDRASLPYVFMANRMGDRLPMVFSAHGLLMRDSDRPRLRDRWSARGVQAVTAVSEPAAREYARLLGWDGHTTIIDNGVPPISRTDDFRRLVRSQLGVDDDVFVYLAVGNAKPEKGFEDLIRAAAALRDAAGNRRFVVWIAGGVSDEPYQQSLNDLQRGLSMDGAARFLGFRRDTVGLYSAADAFVLSSRKEGLPMVLLESMSAGLPVVATNVGAVSTAVVDGKNGLLVAPADPPKLAEAMLCLLRDGALCGRLGQAAACEARNRYGLERMAGEYFAAYQQAARGRALVRPHVNDGRPRVLMLGPMPPLTGGMATVVENLQCSPLAQVCALDVLNNGKTTPADRSLFAGVWSQAALLGKVLGHVVRHRAQIVHIHTCALFSFWRDIGHALAVRMLGRKVIWHIHDGTFAAFLGEGPAIKRRIIRWGLRLGAAVIVLSEVSRQALAPLAAGVRWRVVPNGVALPREAAPGREGRPRFLFLGNLTHRKGAFDLVDAAEAAYKRGVAAEFLLAGGEVQSGQRDELLRHIEGLSCRENVRLLGILSGAAKEQALAESYCVVLPSYAEGLPMAVLEGMAYGRPIIATRVGAVPEVITDGREGFLIEPGDVPALAERIIKLSADADLARRMGLAAREQVERDYAISVVVGRIAEIYSEVCQRGNMSASMEQK